MATQSTNITLDQVQQDLSFLLGETSVPIPTPTDRTTYIERALERVYRSFNFSALVNTATLAVTNGVVSLNPDTIFDPKLDVRVVNSGVGDDRVFTRVAYEQQDNYGPGDFRYYLSGTPGAYQLVTSEALANPALSYVTVRYTQAAPVINSSISTPFPSSMCLARGALVYYRQAEDPQADLSQLEAFFKTELEEVIATQIRNQPDSRATTRQDMMGTYTGDTGGTWGDSGWRVSQ